ncbi:M56 family metallopeptidase [Winogradskyella endarachnes]|uniref:BlaR1 peptidase M56 family protein n=1 Tax=Winogradskyella endarachnes TaxID=2681965 RepID=A0A6L6UD52_9FLAO|nr:M56 family metallopeptidase [Winogradskyella endarachnes]MUU78694.1 blaR1 peptidase M56 family protein [Winogradskyella endarachnes]
MLYSILQIIAIQALFLLVYDLFLKRETFFNYNRAYLIITSILSLVLPFVKFPALKTMATKDMVIRLPEVFIGTKSPTNYDIQIAEQAGIIIEQPQPPIWQIIAITGIAVASLIFFAKIAKIYWLKHRNPKRWQGNVLIVNLIKSSAAFSFFNTIFLGEHILDSEKPTIYKHELVHIKEFHTIDLLFFEVLRIIFWFNPLVYIYQNRIKELHEYIADAKAVKQTGKSEYYTSLLNQVLDVNHVSFTNTFFNKSLIKKRIVMLQKSKSKQLNLVKYALLIPMVFAMLIYTSTEVRAQKKDEVKHKVYQELTDTELIEKYYDEIVAMKNNGATFMEIMEFAGFSEKNKEQYMLSRTEFLKMKAYFEYIADGILEKKLAEGSLTEKDIESSERLRLNKFKNYEEFKAFKNTKEEKERWESDTEGGVLKLFVNDVANKTEEETKRYNGLLKQLENDNYFNELVVTDGKSTLVLDSYVSNDGEEIIKEEVEVLEVPFSVVEETPTTVDCKDLESTKERKKCFNAFVNKHIGKNFNTSIADSLSPGKKRIFVQFKIDKEGKVGHIVARGPSKALEEEAKRVVATLPQFVPGKQKGEAVVVPFSIPIVFEVKGDNNTKDNQSSDNGELIYIPFNKVDSPAVFPDCNSISDTTEQRDCTVNAINKFIVQKFNMSAHKFTNLAAGRKRIYAHFIIDEFGNVTNIEAKSAHPELDEEANRVIALLPQFTPAKHKGKAIDVRYSLPIMLQFVGNKTD